jgi:hypothetical protein
MTSLNDEESYGSSLSLSDVRLSLSLTFFFPFGWAVRYCLLAMEAGTSGRRNKGTGE